MRGWIAHISKKTKKTFRHNSRSTVFGQLIIFQRTCDRGYISPFERGKEKLKNGEHFRGLDPFLQATKCKVHSYGMTPGNRQIALYTYHITSVKDTLYGSIIPHRLVCFPLHREDILIHSLTTGLSLNVTKVHIRVHTLCDREEITGK